VHGSILAG
jgi:hypothetical protein